jgi:hypothetical protein
MSPSRFLPGVLSQHLLNLRPIHCAAIVAIMLAAGPAAAFDCPVPQPVTDQDAIKETPARIAQLSDELKADETGSATEGAIFELKRSYPNATFAEIVNYMVTAYCPIIAENNSLSDEEKRSRLDRYAQQVEALAAK